MRRVLSLALLLVLVGSSIRPVVAGPTADLRLLEQRVAALWGDSTLDIERYRVSL